MRQLATVILAAFGIASAAAAQSLVVDTDAAVYAPGDTITVTATLDTTGAPAGNFVIVVLSWNGARAIALGTTPSFNSGSSSQLITAGANAGNSNLTSVDGALPWGGPGQNGCMRFGAGAGNTCIVLSQFVLTHPFAPDVSTLVGTLALEAVDLGTLDLIVSVTDAFGASATLGPNLAGGVTIAPQVPGPGVGGLAALAILMSMLAVWMLGRSRRPAL